MTTAFNTTEIFEMAEQIERNGARFYRKAAQEVTGLRARGLFEKLAKMEDEHESLFSEMKRKAGDSSLSFDQDTSNEALLYLQALADDRIFEDDPTTMLENQYDIAAVLQKAISLERDSIAFYTGMQQLALDEPTRRNLVGIIREEMSHVTYLSNLLSSLTSE
ncbi:MAG: ferritin family protein [Planctomycetota bacterium]|nr:ferritin family protein [Planctomycetota bacterium]